MNNILKILVTAVLPLLSEDVLKQGLDSLFDTLENAIDKSSTKIDDIVLLPVIKQLREHLNVPDND